MDNAMNWCSLTVSLAKHYILTFVANRATPLLRTALLNLASSQSMLNIKQIPFSANDKIQHGHLPQRRVSQQTLNNRNVATELDLSPLQPKQVVSSKNISYFKQKSGTFAGFDLVGVGVGWPQNDGKVTTNLW